MNGSRPRRILLVHQNFPGQFKHLGPALAADPKNEVVGFTMNKNPDMAGIRIVRYQAARRTTPGVHPWVAETEAKVIRGEAAFRAALALREQGFAPDLIYAHPGWGESLFLKDVWPDARLVVYCEFYYHAKDLDVDFDPEFLSTDPTQACTLRMKNVNMLLNMEMADAGIAPTHWQKSTYPEFFQPRISVIHDGIDTDALRPVPGVTIEFGDRKLGRNDEVITFVNRNLEPYRGYHVFMRALPEILARRPNAQVLIVGGDKVSYGAAAPEGKTWKQIFLDEVRERLDMSRVHFVGSVPYPHFVGLLQISTVHVYLTYPFVLSWSLLEAMSCGCAIVASDTAPVREAISDGRTGRLVDFFSSEQLADSVSELLADAAARRRLGAAARAFAVEHYDLKRVCLPQQLALVGGERT